MFPQKNPRCILQDLSGIFEMTANTFLTTCLSSYLRSLVNRGMIACGVNINLLVVKCLVLYQLCSIYKKFPLIVSLTGVLKRGKW